MRETPKNKALPVEELFDACPQCGSQSLIWAGWSKRVTRRSRGCFAYLTEGRRDVRKCVPCGHTWRYGRNGPVTDRKFATRGVDGAFYPYNGSNAATWIIRP